MKIGSAVRWTVVFVLGPTSLATVARGQQHPLHARSPSPSTIESRRSAEGRLQLSAVYVDTRVEVDGALDDPVWRAPGMSGFVQAEPDEGTAATERTVVWVAFNDAYLYIAAHCYDAYPDQIVVSDIRKDFRRDNQDTFEVILDTFADRRNGYLFATTPAGGRYDEQVANEGREINPSWDAPWTVRTRQVADGWTVEMAIPFRSLRFDETLESGWGVNFSRRLRRKNELDYWSPVPRSYALTRLSLAGDLTGLRTGNRGRDLRITPYVAAKTVRETGVERFDQTVGTGGDLKYGVTDGLTLDVTVNPDFAQVEADEQEVNLTQFSQFFPEKREFFLENSGLFYVGDIARNTRVSLAPRVDEDLLLFFSRRIGLAADGLPIPIHAGVRLTGREGGVLVGALAGRTGTEHGEPASDYVVVRLRRNVFASSDVGGLFMMRSSVDQRDDYNRVYGVDANIRLPGAVDWSSYVVNTETPGLSGSRYAYQTSFNREGNFFHVQAGLLALGENFNDELGYYRRTGVRKWSVSTGLRPRLAGLRRRGVREMHPHLDWNFYTDLSGELIAKRLHTGYTLFLNNGGWTEFSVNPQFEQLTVPFTIHRDLRPIEAGEYGWTEYQLRVSSDPSRTLAASVTGILGGLWSGTQRTVRATVTVKPSYRFRADVGVSRTSADLGDPDTDFVRELWTARANYSFTTNMFVDALVQYDADREVLNANVRLNVIHHPLSNLYLVYNERRFTTDQEQLPGRSVILKFTQMLAF